MIGVPIVFHIGGLMYSSLLHNQNLAFTSAYLMFVIYLNSLIMLIVHFVTDAKRRRHIKGES